MKNSETKRCVYRKITLLLKITLFVWYSGFLRLRLGKLLLTSLVVETGKTLVGLSGRVGEIFAKLLLRTGLFLTGLLGRTTLVTMGLL